MTTDNNSNNTVREVKKFKCPQCYSEIRVFDLEQKHLEERGVHGKGELYCMKKDVVQLIPIQAAKLTMPVVCMYWDICYSCGTPYIFRIDAQDAPIQFAQQQHRGRTN